MKTKNYHNPLTFRNNSLSFSSLGKKVFLVGLCFLSKQTTKAACDLENLPATHELNALDDRFKFSYTHCEKSHGDLHVTVDGLGCTTKVYQVTNISLCESGINYTYHNWNPSSSCPLSTARLNDCLTNFKATCALTTATPSPTTLNISRTPSKEPTERPTYSHNPTQFPSRLPTDNPIPIPTSRPTLTPPTFMPTLLPSGNPTFYTDKPTPSPTQYNNQWVLITMGTLMLATICVCATLSFICICCPKTRENLVNGLINCFNARDRDRAEERVSNAALKIQTVFRGHNAKARARARAEERDRNAAVQIQTVVRGHNARARARDKKIVNAAVQIQKVVRGRNARARVSAAENETHVERTVDSIEIINDADSDNNSVIVDQNSQSGSEDEFFDMIQNSSSDDEAAINEDKNPDSEQNNQISASSSPQQIQLQYSSAKKAKQLLEAKKFENYTTEEMDILIKQFDDEIFRDYSNLEFDKSFNLRIDSIFMSKFNLICSKNNISDDTQKNLLFNMITHAINSPIVSRSLFPSPD